MNEHPAGEKASAAGEECLVCGHVNAPTVPACSRCGAPVRSAPIPQAPAAELTTARGALAAERGEGGEGAAAGDHSGQRDAYDRQRTQIQAEWRAYYSEQDASPQATRRAAYRQPTGGTNSMAIAGFVLLWVCGLPGIICAHVALSQIRRTGEGGRGLAIATLIIGYSAIAAFVILYVVASSALS